MWIKLKNKKVINKINKTSLLIYNFFLSTHNFKTKQYCKIIIIYILITLHLILFKNEYFCRMFYTFFFFFFFFFFLIIISRIIISII